jgi:hypothetical protein
MTTAARNAARNSEFLLTNRLERRLEWNGVKWSNIQV